MNRRFFLKSLGLAGAGVALLKSNSTVIAGPAPKTGIKKLLFDSWSTQVTINNTTGTIHPIGGRLGTILGALYSFGQVIENGVNYDYNIYFTRPPNIARTQLPPNTSFLPPAPPFETSPISAKVLEGINVYISLTRPPSNPYQQSELQALHDFVLKGGSILLHANHGPNQGQNPVVPYDYWDDYTHSNAPLAGMFGITLLPYIVYQPYNDKGLRNGAMLINVNPLSDPHLQSISNLAPRIASHDSCIIVPPSNNFYSIAQFPPLAQVVRWGNSLRPIVPLTPLRQTNLSKHFSILVPYGKGKVIVVGNSGMITDYGSPSPSPGIVPMESNLMFFLNCVSFLAGYPPDTQLPGNWPPAWPPAS